MRRFGPPRTFNTLLCARLLKVLGGPKRRIFNKIVVIEVSRAYFLTICVIIYQHMGAYLFVTMHYTYICPDAPVFHASGSGQNPHVADPWLSPGKSTRRAVTTIGSNDLVVGEDHMLGPSCQRYNWQTGRCDSIAFGRSPRRGKTLISNPRCLAEVSTFGKDFRR